MHVDPRRIIRNFNPQIIRYECCIDKVAPPYEGLTMKDLRSRPGLVDDTAIIEDMRAYELKKLDPKKLGNHQLYASLLSPRFNL